MSFQHPFRDKGGFSKKRGILSLKFHLFYKTHPILLFFMRKAYSKSQLCIAIRSAFLNCHQSYVKDRDPLQNTNIAIDLYHGGSEMNQLENRPKIVIALGGSILLPSLHAHTISRYVPVISEIAAKALVYIIVGGGKIAREYINISRSIGADEATADEIGIAVTRINASLLISALGDVAYPLVPATYHEALSYGLLGRVVVMGGVVPGQTTDAVSAVLAERVGASLLVNATSVDGIYSADPNNPAYAKTAKRYDTITTEKLLEIVQQGSMCAGSNNVMDLVAVKMIDRCKIPLVVLDGRDPANVLSALQTGKFVGTIVSENGISPFPLFS
jgi:uridylate kinase